ncbi:TetR/AcrR family transcriptional regulator [Georgenia alba]|uniref:TetR/AcrR family transcriptional regulator n=1 Tax=Georgenia alba TaxID=2233858 RepID=A0ABW2Q2M7_9MICO
MTSRDEIVDAAMAICEEVGVEGLSMRVLGRRIGTSAMAVYRHVPNRQALLDAVVGRVLAGVPLPEHGMPWPERLRTVAHGLLDAAVAHPSVFPMALRRSYVADEAIAVMTTMYGILTDAGVPARDLPRLERMLSTALLGFAVTASSGGFWTTDPDLVSGRLVLPDGGSPAADADPDRWRAELDRNVADLVRLVEGAAAA